MAKLILLRHLQSQWNKENKFSGWTDVPLSEEGMATAGEKAQKLADVKIDEVFTSPLSRNKNTVFLVLADLGQKAIFLEPGEKADLATNSFPVYVTDTLNERSYGLLEGMNKGEVKEKFGEERTYAWRRSWDVAPPEGESLKEVCTRAIPFYQNFVEPQLRAGKTVLIVASHNSLRALIKYIEDISNDDIINLEIPFGGMVVYDLDENLKVKTKEIR
ncbi:MAG: 2,3-diphosphoglycerate-dependent phosphoglycerate mutase [Candidatus Paceibacterota bacterium]|jgi:2,3-bisphosphoglycerate-dependent phosphoglycerate mutase